ncbi:Glutathione peroxidase 3 [Camelus dromedarius]|uniref:glutathione peroxidase n=1 Tax=Camelus dromedarius TaxID=9838 RepID=A0A5N4ECH3_CAMDR|nr:Glutathione peroxidase 3 [Camelus dromedarius]
MARLFRASCLLSLLLAGFVPPSRGQEKLKMDCHAGASGTIYEYGALTIDGEEYIPFKKYAGKYILFVNGPEKLNALQEELGPFGLVILGFPCNQFGKQEPGENSEILSSLKYVRPGGGFVPNFQLFEKGDVNGEKEQKFYTFLKNSCPPTSELLGSPGRLFWEPMKVHDIRWNFEKFLVGPDGIPIMRWYHRTTVNTVKMDILAYMRRRAALEAKGK